MKRLFKISPQLHRGVALILLLAVLLVVAMAAAPAWHEWAHHDAGQADHDCAVTLFASGSAADQVAAPPVLAGGLLPWVETVRVEAAPEVIQARAAGRIRERAPPVSVA